MRRYIFNGDLKNINRINTDVVIVGCGVAGLYSALCLDPQLSCAVLNKTDAQTSNSMYAQGGIAAVIEPHREQDDPQQHYEDTLVAGAGLCEKDAVRVLVDEGWSNIERLIEINVPFDRHDGNLRLTREGGHHKNRILHCGGDATGLHLTRRLYEVAIARNNISVYDKMFLSDILTDENGVTGVLVLDGNNTPCIFTASRVIIASGGIGRVYRNSTNFTGATGDGIAAARRAGAVLKDMEFVQFHPTAFIHPDDNGRFFLISEALRGEGAVLRNRRGEPFMKGKHPLSDLAPRDIVSRCIIMEMKKSDIPNVYLDITLKSRNFLKNRFPTIYAECMRRCVDIAKDWIPVMPVQHYFMGGIKTDIDGRTNIPGLYACGEAACTGVHGANRLASNSLLECLVFGRRCSIHINENPGCPPLDFTLGKRIMVKDGGVDFDSYSSEIRAITTLKCGIIRNGKDLKEGEARINEIFRQLDEMELDTPKCMETYNQSLIALEILRASIQRKESVGAHYRYEDKLNGGNEDAE